MLIYNAGLWALQEVSRYKEEDYQFLNEKYRKRAVEVRDERREAVDRKLNRLTQKEELLRDEFTLLQKARQAQEFERARLDNIHFKVVLDEWDSRPLEWKLKQLAYAKKFPENEYAQAIVAKAEEVPHPLGSVTTVTTVTTVTDKEDS